MKKMMMVVLVMLVVIAGCKEDDASSLVEPNKMVEDVNITEKDNNRSLDEVSEIDEPEISIINSRIFTDEDVVIWENFSKPYGASFTFNELDSEFGKVISENRESIDENFDFVTREYQGIIIELYVESSKDQGRISNIILSGNQISLVRGINVGDSYSDVINKYKNDENEKLYNDVFDDVIQILYAAPEVEKYLYSDYGVVFFDGDNPIEIRYVGKNIVLFVSIENSVVSSIRIMDVTTW